MAQKPPGIRSFTPLVPDSQGTTPKVSTGIRRFTPFIEEEDELDLSFELRKPEIQEIKPIQRQAPVMRPPLDSELAQSATPAPTPKPTLGSLWQMGAPPIPEIVKPSGPRATPSMEGADRGLFAPEASIGDRAKDLTLSMAKGIIGLGDAVTGLTQLVATAGEEGVVALGLDPGERPSVQSVAKKFLGWDSKKWKAYLDTQLSPEQQAENAAVERAKGFTGTLGALAENPSVAVQSAVESLPAMYLGGLIGRGVSALPARAGAIGEATLAAGQQVSDITEQSGGKVTPGQVALGAASGVFTGLVNRAMGKLADKYGYADIDTMFAASKTNPTLLGAIESVSRSVAKIPVAVGSEAAEELFQTQGEVISSNLALGKPWNEGIGKASAIAAATGGLMGGAAQAVSTANRDIRRAPRVPVNPGNSGLPVGDEAIEGAKRIEARVAEATGTAPAAHPAAPAPPPIVPPPAAPIVAPGRSEIPAELPEAPDLPSDINDTPLEQVGTTLPAPTVQTPELVTGGAPARYVVDTLVDGVWEEEDTFDQPDLANRFVGNSKFWDGNERRIRDAGTGEIIPYDDAAYQETQRVDESPVVEQAGPAEGIIAKIGNVARSEVIDGVLYTLSEDGVVRVNDVDTGSSVERVTYPSIDAANAAFDNAVETARQVSEPPAAPELPQTIGKVRIDPEAKSPAASGNGEIILPSADVPPAVLHHEDGHIVRDRLSDEDRSTWQELFRGLPREQQAVILESYGTVPGHVDLNTLEDEAFSNLVSAVRTNDTERLQWFPDEMVDLVRRVAAIPGAATIAPGTPIAPRTPIPTRKKAKATAPAPIKPGDLVRVATNVVGSKARRQATPEERAVIFTPGNEVPAYSGGNDTVVSYNPGTNGEGWSVTVRGQDGRTRNHATNPEVVKAEFVDKLRPGASRDFYVPEAEAPKKKKFSEMTREERMAALADKMKENEGGNTENGQGLPNDAPQRDAAPGRREGDGRSDSDDAPKGRSKTVPRKDRIAKIANERWPAHLADARSQGFTGTDAELREIYDQGVESARTLIQDMLDIADETDLLAWVREQGGLDPSYFGDGDARSEEIKSLIDLLDKAGLKGKNSIIRTGEGANKQANAVMKRVQSMLANANRDHAAGKITDAELKAIKAKASEMAGTKVGSRAGMSLDDLASHIKEHRADFGIETDWQLLEALKQRLVDRINGQDQNGRVYEFEPVIEGAVGIRLGNKWWAGRIDDSLTFAEREQLQDLVRRDYDFEESEIMAMSDADLVSYTEHINPGDRLMNDPDPNEGDDSFDVDALERESDDPVAARVAELEAMATDEAMGTIFPEDDDPEGASKFPDGSYAIVCTNCAKRIIAMNGGKGEIYGWPEGDNPTAIVANSSHDDAGHDFAFIDGRFIVDAWGKNVEGSIDRAVYDLENTADKAEVLRLFGDPNTWVRFNDKQDKFEPGHPRQFDVVDTLDTGEQQPRLPGAADARKAGKASTTFRAPQQASGDDFSLGNPTTPEAAAREEAEEKPGLFGTEDAPKLDPIEAKRAELKARKEELFKKLGQNLNTSYMGIDPTNLGLVVDLLEVYIEEGVLTFKEFVKRVHRDAGRRPELDPYLEAAWELARDEPGVKVAKVVEPIPEPETPKVDPAREALGNKPVGFGKYKDVLVKDLFLTNPSYVDWLMESATSSRVQPIIDYIKAQPEYIASKQPNPNDPKPVEITDDIKKLLKKAKLVIQGHYAKEGITFIAGKTYDLREELGKLGGRWDRDSRAYKFAAVPFAKLVAFVQEKFGAADGRTGIGTAKWTRDAKLRNLREKADATPDQSVFTASAPIENYIGADTKAMLREGLKIGMPAMVVDEQIEDVARIVRANELGKPVFLLASEPGSGKTYVLGGAIREMQKRGVKKITYVTLRRELISQIKQDLKAYGIKDVKFVTYPEMRDATPEASDAIIFDEAHAIKNVDETIGGSARQAKAAAAWIKESKYTVLATATPSENPVQMEYIKATGIFEPLFENFGNFALSFGATAVKLRGGRGLVTWRRTETSDADAAAARQWLIREGIYTSRRIRLPENQVDSRMVKVEVSDRDQRRYDAFTESATENAGELGGFGPAWIKNFQKRLLEAAKVQQGITEARAALKRGRYPIIFVETKAERTLDIPDLIQRFQDWQMAVAMTQRGEKKPTRKEFGVPPPGVVETLTTYMEKTGESKIVIPSAEDVIQEAFKDKVAIFTGSVTPNKAQENLDSWRRGELPVLVATMAKGGTGLSLHDKVGDHQTTQININLPWTATGVVQVSQRSARYGLKGKAEMQWIFAENIPFDRLLANKVGGRMADMGSLIHGERLQRSDEIEDWNFEDEGFADDKAITDPAGDRPLAAGVTPASGTTAAAFRRLPPPPAGGTAPAATSGMRPSQIVEDLLKALGGVPVGIGRFRQKALGIFKPKIRAIRLKLANDLQTVFHEAGHDFDVEILKIDRRDPRWAQELLKLGQGTSMGSYTNTQIAKEGAAEFFRLWITEPATARAEAPNYYAAFEAALSGHQKLNADIRRVRDNIQGLIAQDPATQAALRIDWDGAEPTTRELLSTPEGRAEMITRASIAWVDDLQALKNAVEDINGGMQQQFVKNAHVLAANARGSASVAEGFLEYGPRGYDGQFIGPSLKDALSKISKDEQTLKDFGEYLVALRAIELISRGKETGFDLVNAEALRNKHANKPDFQDARDQIYKYQDALLEYAKVYGAMGQEQLDVLRQMNENYVPFQRVMDALGGSPSRGGGIANRLLPVFRLKGSGRDVVNPFESIIKNTFAIVDMVQKNNAALALVDSARNSEGSAKWIERVDPKIAPRSVTVEKLSSALGSGGSDALRDLGYNPDDVITTFAPVLEPSNKDRVITVMRRGKVELHQVHDQQLYDAIVAIGPQASSKIIEWASKPAAWLRAGATLTVGFISRNPGRDSLVAFIQSRYGHIPGVDFARGVISILMNDDDAKLYYTSGVAQASLVGSDRKRVREQIDKLSARDKAGILKRVTFHPIDTLRAVSEFMETATRLGEFRNVLDAGGQERGVVKRLIQGKRNRSVDEETLTRATYAARMVTTDFSRAGNIAREINRVDAFFNAQVQGYVRMGEELRHNPVGVSLRASTLMLFSLALAYINAGDDEWEEKPAWEKNAYWFIPTPSGYMRFPKPFDWALPGNIVESFVSWSRTNRPDAFKRNMPEIFGSGANSLILTAAALLPTAISPVVEAGFNYDPFRRRNVVSPYDLDLDPELQFNDWTSETAKIVGRHTGISPAKLDHIIYGYGAGLGRGAISAFDTGLRIVGQADAKNAPAKNWSDAPVVGVFYDDRKFGSGSETIKAFYNAYEEMRGFQSSMKRYTVEEQKDRRKEAEGKVWFRRQDTMRGVYDEIKEQRDRIQRIYDAPIERMSREEKRKQLDAVYRTMVNKARRGLGKPPLKMKEQ